MLGFLAVLMLPIGSAVWAFRGSLEVRAHTRNLADNHYPVLDAASRAATRLTTFQATAERACNSFDSAALEHATGMAGELDGGRLPFHGARDTRCDLRWRGIADGRARGVFGGRIVVEPGADGTDARLENKNLLLSPHAEIDTKPVLEIHADEVKASHGATVGQLDEEQLLYLQTRGIERGQAIALLTEGFLRAGLLDCSNNALNEFLLQQLLAAMPATAVEVAA